MSSNHPVVVAISQSGLKQWTNMAKNIPKNIRCDFFTLNLTYAGRMSGASSNKPQALRHLVTFSLRVSHITRSQHINLILRITYKTLSTYMHLVSHSLGSSSHAAGGLNALCLRMMSALVEAECPHKSRVN